MDCKLFWTSENNIELARAFVGGLSFEEFQSDRRSFYAATRALEIVSEAARRLPAELRSAHPELPWRAIMGVGNVYRHDYDDVAEEFVWRTVQHGLERLLALVVREIESLAGPGEHR